VFTPDGDIIVLQGLLQYCCTGNRDVNNKCAILRKYLWIRKNSRRQECSLNKGMAAEDPNSKADAIDTMPIGIEGLVELDLSIFPMLGDKARGPTA